MKAIFLPKGNKSENLVIKQLKIEYSRSNDQYFHGPLVVIIMEFWNKYRILGNYFTMMSPSFLCQLKVVCVIASCSH